MSQNAVASLLFFWTPQQNYPPHSTGLGKVEHRKPFTTYTFNKPSALVHFTHPKSRLADVSNKTHFTWLSPFLYSSEQSRRTMRGFLIRRRILGWVTSLFTMIPRKTQESSLKPPGIWQTQGRDKMRSVSLVYKNLCISISWSVPHTEKGKYLPSNHGACRSLYKFNFKDTLN